MKDIKSVEIVEDDKGHYTIECELPMMPVPIVEQIVNSVVDKVREDKTVSKKCMKKAKEIEKNIDEALTHAKEIIHLQNIKITILWIGIFALTAYILFIK